MFGAAIILCMRNAKDEAQEHKKTEVNDFILAMLLV